MAQVPLALVDDPDEESLTEALDRPTETAEDPTRPGRHRHRRRRREQLREDEPAFASSRTARTVRFALCVASLIGLAYATIVVLGLLRPGETEALGLPSRHPSETDAPLAAPGRPLSVETENDAQETTVTASPSATASASASPRPSESAAAESESPAPSEPADEDESPSPTPPADSDDGNGDEDERGKLIDVNLLGIRISI
ncbi:hypothetical protein [Cryptosporangium phraense]|uniref:Uncharacterized protein n=1 Tax=Cryptosporangium phraense TaxID=2593070 RepID=A0A545AMJ8_9ACTN|nr:hypothetical protein [Cryptosporangium phraense]TQS42526.1 hypothetical protein FL583_24840 [Cryptosporangium phraense]